MTRSDGLSQWQQTVSPYHGRCCTSRNRRHESWFCGVLRWRWHKLRHHQCGGSDCVAGQTRESGVPAYARAVLRGGALRSDLSHGHPGASRHPEGVGCVLHAPTAPCPILSRSRSASGRGASARSRSPAGVVRTADRNVARRGIWRMARTPRGGWVSRSS